MNAVRGGMLESVRRSCHCVITQHVTPVSSTAPRVPYRRLESPFSTAAIAHPGTEAATEKMYTKNVTDFFEDAMNSRNLEKSLSQIELVRTLRDLQNSLMECYENRILQARLKAGYLELMPKNAEIFLQGGSTKGFSIWRKLVNNLSAPTPTNEKIPPAATTYSLSCNPYPDFPDLRSLYIWGGVGQGKTMIMDIFYNSTDIPAKTRAHFHNFMLDVQQRLHIMHTAAAKANPPGASLVEPPIAWDPVLRLAWELASTTHLLCLDEFQVLDIADAMILKRLFEGLLHVGL